MCECVVVGWRQLFPRSTPDWVLAWLIQGAVACMYLPRIAGSADPAIAATGLVLVLTARHLYVRSLQLHASGPSGKREKGVNAIDSHATNAYEKGSETWEQNDVCPSLPASCYKKVGRPSACRQHLHMNADKSWVCTTALHPHRYALASLYTFLTHSSALACQIHGQ